MRYIVAYLVSRIGLHHQLKVLGSNLTVHLIDTLKCSLGQVKKVLACSVHKRYGYGIHAVDTAYGCLLLIVKEHCGHVLKIYRSLCHHQVLHLRHIIIIGIKLHVVLAVRLVYVTQESTLLVILVKSLAYLRIGYVQCLHGLRIGAYLDRLDTAAIYRHAGYAIYALQTRYHILIYNGPQTVNATRSANLK